MTRYRRFAAIVTVFVVAAIPVLAPSPALAAGTGEVIFECQARFSAFPSSAGSGTCTDGLIPAVAEVSASGVFGPSGLPYIVAGVGSTSAGFTYSSSCIAGEPPVLTAVAGTATVTDVSAFANGAQTRADLVVAFTAQVAGTEIVIVINEATFTFENGGSVSGIGQGKGQLFPLLQPNNSSCPEGGPMMALVHGEIDLVLL